MQMHLAQFSQNTSCMFHDMWLVFLLQVSQLYQDTTLGYPINIILVGLVFLDGREVSVAERLFVLLGKSCPSEVMLHHRYICSWYCPFFLHNLSYTSFLPVQSAFYFYSPFGAKFSLLKMSLLDTFL